MVVRSSFGVVRSSFGVVRYNEVGLVLVVPTLLSIFATFLVKLLGVVKGWSKFLGWS